MPRSPRLVARLVEKEKKEHWGFEPITFSKDELEKRIELQKEANFQEWGVLRYYTKGDSWSLLIQILDELPIEIADADMPQNVRCYCVSPIFHYFLHEHLTLIMVLNN